MSGLKKIALVAAVVVTCWANFSQAQSLYCGHSGHKYNNGTSLYHTGNHPIYRAHVGYGNHYHYNWGGFRYGHNGHAAADIIRSRAQANFVNAKARTENEVTRSARLDNDVKELATHIERRSINASTRFSHLWEQGAKARATKAELTEAARIAGVELDTAMRLDESQLNRVSGRLSWPLLLQMEHFNRARKPVNQVFKTRALAGKINPDHYLPLIDWVKKIDAELIKNAENYPDEDLASAQDFLRRLTVEARLAVPNNSLTAASQLASR